MKYAKKALGVLLTVAFLMSAAAMTAAAKPDSGLAIIPLEDHEDDLDYWETQTANDEYAPLNSEGCWVKTTLGDDGSLTLEKTTDSKNNYPRIRTLIQEDLPEVDLEANPYLYFDFVAESCEWMIQFNHGQNSVKLAKGIVGAVGQDELVGAEGLLSIDKDGPAGHYTGKLNLAQYYREENITGLAGQTKLNAPNVVVYIVNPSAGGRLTINSLSIGNDDADQASGPKLNLLLKNGDWDEEDEENEGEDDTTAADSTTTRSAAETTFSRTSAASTNTETDASADGTWIYIVTAAVAVVVVVGAVAAVMVIRKRKGRTAPDQVSDPSDRTEKK
ncbi:MAG: hypothetical protein HFJ80_05025 [Clostridiales bacterium]|nr:hypothetical protein [Clostridiales bacterium]